MLSEALLKIDPETLLKYDPKAWLKIGPQTSVKNDLQLLTKKRSTNITQKLIHKRYSENDPQAWL